MSFKQRLLEGILVGVVGGLVASAIGGMGVLAYSEMQKSRIQLEKTTDVAEQLNTSSITGIGRMNKFEEKLSLISERLDKISEEISVLSNVSTYNSKSISGISDSITKIQYEDSKLSNFNIKLLEDYAAKSSHELGKLPQINAEIENIKNIQQQQQVQLEVYRNTQNIQQTQQQQQQQAW